MCGGGGGCIKLAQSPAQSGHPGQFHYFSSFIVDAFDKQLSFLTNELSY